MYTGGAGAGGATTSERLMDLAHNLLDEWDGR
jgi:hypothetical protein